MNRQFHVWALLVNLMTDFSLCFVFSVITVQQYHLICNELKEIDKNQENVCPLENCSPPLLSTKHTLTNLV